MGIARKDLKRLFARSGNRCAFPDCRRLLVLNSTDGSEPVTLGDIAHIVARSESGPRGQQEVVDREGYNNLILLCNRHHQLVDAQPQKYTPERLLGLKRDHEKWVESSLGRGDTEVFEGDVPAQDTLYSTLLPVTQMPKYVFGATTKYKTEQEIGAKLGEFRRGEMTPFILRNNKVFAFQDLRVKDNPFAGVIIGSVQRHDVSEWETKDDEFRWLVDLLNRSLNKLTGRLGLAWDKKHRRYYFQMSANGEPLEISYRPLNAKTARRAVVWQPISKRTGAARNYWYHRAVALRFVRVGTGEWVLSIRPELRVTTDGVEALPSEGVGRRVTRKKSRLFNYDLLGEVQFWRDFLGASSSRILFKFGSRDQKVIVSTQIMGGVVTWPGIPSEHSKPFRNIDYVDDLLTWAEAEGPDEVETGRAWEEELEDEDELSQS